MHSTPLNSIRIGTRGSKLALWQARWVANTLMKLHPHLHTELVVISTRGDRTLGALIPEIGGKGFFTEELDQHLLRGEIEIAVHSLKDLPTSLPAGLALGAVCNREWVRDVLVARAAQNLESLPYAARVGTCSLRRTAQIRHLRPDVQIHPLRGNVPTRLEKLQQGEYDAIVLAEAGIRRLGLDAHITQVFPPGVVLPAPAQGALGVEIRSGHHRLQELISPLDDIEARATTSCERALLNRLGAGCQVPVAALAEHHAGQLTCHGLIASIDGAQLVRRTMHGRAEAAQALGEALAEQLLQDGGEAILATLPAKAGEIYA
ncbi:MAG: hydroxymethylbilane synthase [bacterium]